MDELMGVLRCNRHRSINDFCWGKVPDLQLRWAAIRGAIKVVSYAPSGFWSVRVRESEKVLMEARGQWGGPKVLRGVVCQEAGEPTGL